MAKLKFFTQYERPEQDFEVQDDTVVVERAGYVPAKQQIESFIQSGQLLMASRRAMYDYGVGEEDDDMPIMDNIYEDDPIEMQQYADKMNELSEQMKKEQAEKQKQQNQPEEKEPEKEPEKTDKKE